MKKKNILFNYLFSISKINWNKYAKAYKSTLYLKLNDGLDTLSVLRIIFFLRPSILFIINFVIFAVCWWERVHTKTIICKVIIITHFDTIL
jgi:hypothetical protein